MKRFFIPLAALWLAGCGASSDASSNARPEVTLASLLDEMVSYDAVVRAPSPAYRAAQVSSYDRRTVSPQQPGWWANDDGAGFERLDTIGGRVEKVLFDRPGPGAVTRIWMTTSDKRGMLRFYFDGAASPQIEIPAYDMARFPIDAGPALSLKHTHYDSELSKTGGNTFFLPLPYARSCRITLEEPDYAVRIPRYYHIGYRSYDPQTEVKTFSLREARRLSARIAEVNRKLSAPETFTAGTECTRTVVSAAGDDASLRLPDGSKAVRSLTVALADFDPADRAEIMRQTYLCADFDGIRCVKAPLDCFFGAGTGAPAVEGWYFSVNDRGRCTSRWVMPYAQHAELRLEKRTSVPFTAVITAYVDDFDCSDEPLYFHATYREEHGIPVNNDYDSAQNLDWNFTTVDGRGVYCGDVLSLYNHCPDWYGEGDEKIWVDDDRFPSFMGTGTEDYYNCSWAPVVPFATPFGGAPRADEASSHGYNTFVRTRHLDVIPFGRRLRFDLEMLSWHPGTVDYRAAAFWYGTAASRTTDTN